MGIRARIVLFFTSFVVLILCVIYIVQVLMLSVFYRSTKLSELDKINELIFSSLGTPDAEETVYQIGTTYKTCILVLSVENGEISDRFASFCSEPNTGRCAIHNMSNAALISLYGEALESRDFTKKTITSLTNGLRETGNSDQKTRTDVSVALLVSSVTAKNGKTYAVFLDTELSPMLSVNNMQKSQFFWLALSVVIASIAAAYLFSLRISVPLRRMNDKAKKLAMGDYTPDFKEEGYKETCELAATLNYAASEISKSDKLRRELISNVSHDLRTPLTMISGYAEVMRDIPGENTPENVQMIIDESKHLSTLVNDMLDLSKIESGVKKISPENFSLTDAVSEVMTRYSALTEHNGYSISFEQDENVMVYADKKMIIQVVYNLVNNAVNYTGEDKVVRVIQRITQKPDGKRVARISVVDTGNGIAPENIGNIWERYYREDGNHKRATVGSGLGLSIVRDILQKHNASFGVESTVGSGSTFWFELPVIK